MPTDTTPTPSRLAHTLAAGRDRAFVGRRAELDWFAAALDGESEARPVHYLHGPGGIGKSTLLRVFAGLAQRAGRPVVEIDGRTVVPTPEGFLAAAGTALHQPGVVLLVDTFEKCQGLEGWLWERFLPQLPVGAVVAVAGRAEPDLLWTSDPGWVDLLRVTALRNLAPEEAAEFLHARHVPASVQQAVLEFTGGNPLALALAAVVAVKDGAPKGDWRPSQDTIATLLRQLIGNTPSSEHSRALEVCAHAYVTSESLLRAVFGVRAAELFAWLRVQPFIESTGAGLFPHDVVREALEADLKWRDPEGFAEMHHQMREVQLAQLRSVPESQLLQATGALIFLYRTDRQISEFNVWRDVGLVEDHPYVESQREQVLELVRRHEGAESAAIAAFWLDHQPQAFRAYLSTQTGELCAFSAWLEIADPVGLEVDPVVAAAWRYARANGPLRSGEYLALARFTIDGTAYQRPAAATTLAQWRATGEMVRGERLAWSFVVMRDDGYWDGHLGDINMLPIDSPPAVGAHRYALFAHDWRTQPPGPWLAEKSAAMLAGASMADGPVRGPAELVVLSRPEFDAAIRDALRTLRRPVALGDNPLNRSRLVKESGKSLTEVLADAAQALLTERGGEKLHRAVSVAYFKGAPTQEVAAELLGLPFSTYRRHLGTAVERMSELLWHHELNGQ
ncbi:ATP-binding protein [Nocardia sp. XZ_19_385]|uniref:ATP-binding protein n=1 Tax=Nocardia sp. XZ_19_385 TaxID=2769488 RepID=UPI00188F9D24|nr:ATP-binding protein [Nocardia sp. XZ_19_385]